MVVSEKSSIFAVEIINKEVSLKNNKDMIDIIDILYLIIKVAFQTMLFLLVVYGIIRISDIICNYLKRHPTIFAVLIALVFILFLLKTNITITY